MSDEALNRIDGAAGSDGLRDLPAAVLRRYLRERQGGQVAYFIDASVSTPAFRDNGRRLMTSRNDPNVVRDMIAIAVHREWKEIAVRGTSDFRREAWLAARAAGLKVRGYEPTARDAQLLARRTRSSERNVDHDSRSWPQAPPLRIIEAVLRARVADPAARERLAARARERLAGWLERDAFKTPTSRNAPSRERPR
ncbi:LPD7 domain-containing protein [Phenylobacterium zucineum]|uniref:LPD7 domain-containing protein n=1 Tax=Phenylobacterium zucineum TaxID=284016 RepID=UPI0011D058D1|nr:LPD7 domain-containing protein [Phenylobacterium zucineum]